MVKYLGDILCLVVQLPATTNRVSKLLNCVALSAAKFHTNRNALLELWQ